jgi:SprT protein
MISNDLTQAVENKILECIDKAEKYFHATINVPKITFMILGRVGGQYSSADNELRFNYELLNENGQKFIDHIVPHEVGHYLVKCFYRPKISHGKEFKGVMKNVLNSNPSTYHNLDISNCTGVKRVKRYVYKCDCREHTVTTSSHKMISASPSGFRCKFCKTRLVFVKMFEKGDNQG